MVPAEPSIVEGALLLRWNGVVLDISRKNAPPPWVKLVDTVNSLMTSVATREGRLVNISIPLT